MEPISRSIYIPTKQDEIDLREHVVCVEQQLTQVGDSDLSCSNKKLGCSTLLTRKEWMDHHVRECPYRPIYCRLIHGYNRGGAILLPIQDYPKHLKEFHDVPCLDWEVAESSKFSFSYDKSDSFLSEYPIPLFSFLYNSKFFIIYSKWNQHSTHIHWSIKLVGSDPEAQEYSATVELQLRERTFHISRTKFGCKVTAIHNPIYDDPTNPCLVLQFYGDIGMEEEEHLHFVITMNKNTQPIQNSLEANDYSTSLADYSELEAESGNESHLDEDSE